MSAIDEAGLRRLVAGDLASLVALRATPRDELVRVARATPGLLVTADAVTSVLEARRAGTAAAAETWRWAKLLLHATHPYVGPPVAPVDPADVHEALDAWVADHTPEFDLPYEAGHERGIARALGALYHDRGDEVALELDRERIDDLERAMQAADPPPAYVEAGDGFEIGVLAGAPITELSAGKDTLSLRVSTSRGDYSIELSQHERSSGVVRGAVVERCVTHGSGVLEIVFVGGGRLVAPPTPRYESWHLSGPELTVFAMPGGDFSYFDDDPRKGFVTSDYDE